MATLETCPGLLAEAPHCRALLRAWLGWRNGDGVPSAGDVRPEQLGGSLSSLVIFEFLPPDRIIYRLVGARHNAVTGRDLKGLDLVDLAPPEERQARLARARDVLSYPCAAVTAGRIVRPSGYVVSYRGLALPIASVTTGQADRVILATDCFGGAAVPDDTPEAGVPLARDCTYVDLGFGAPARVPGGARP